jgi:C-terminal processing protease CtpA/Prc
MSRHVVGAFVAGLNDPHTMYLEPADAKDFTDAIDGHNDFQ